MTNTVEIDIDSDDDAPLDSDDDDANDQEITEADIYGSDLEAEDEFAGVDESLAKVEHKDPVLSVSISPADRRAFVTGGQDDVAVLWAIEETGLFGGLRCVERARLQGHTDSVNQVGFSHDGQYVATGSYDGTAKIWNAASGALMHTLEGPAKEIEWLIWHPKGHAILAGSTDTMAWMWWAPTGKLMQIFAGHAQGVSCGCWAMGGKLICTGSEDRSVIVWNPRAGTPQQHIKGLHESNVISICSHPESPIVVTGSEDVQMKVVHIEQGRILATLGGHSESVEHVAFSNAPAGSLLLLGSCSMDGQVQIFDGKTFETRCALKDHVEKGGVTGTAVQHT
jgi:ribosome assembly protein SQT1